METTAIAGKKSSRRRPSSKKWLWEGAGGICGRLGGDQFALLLLQDWYSEDALVKVQEELSEDFICGIYTFVVHFGVYQVDDASLPVSVMCGRANSALLTIRENVRETVAYFDDEMFEKTLFEQAVIGGFSDALETGQFEMFLQPLVKTDGTVVGGEALARWRKPDGAIVMLGDFIEILESAGLIHELDMHIWELTVAQLATWKDTDKEHLSISVNMSAKDLFMGCGLCQGYYFSQPLPVSEFETFVSDSGAGFR